MLSQTDGGPARDIHTCPLRRQKSAGGVAGGEPCNFAIVTWVLPDLLAARRSSPTARARAIRPAGGKNELKCQIAPFIILVRGCEIKHFELKLPPKSILSMFTQAQALERLSV